MSAIHQQYICQPVNSQAVSLHMDECAAKTREAHIEYHLLQRLFPLGMIRTSEASANWLNIDAGTMHMDMCNNAQRQDMTCDDTGHAHWWE